MVHFGEVVAQHHLGLAFERVVQRVGSHIGVAIAVAAYPVAHAKKRFVYFTYAVFYVGIQLGNFAKKSSFVVRESVFYLVGHG